MPLYSVSDVYFYKGELNFTTEPTSKMLISMYTCVPSGLLEGADYISRYTGCPRRNVRDFGKVFLMLNYTDITQNTYVQSRTVTEIMAREKCELHRCRHTVSRS